jgi:hypothetical protein
MGFLKRKVRVRFLFRGRECLVVVIIVKIYRIDHSPCVHTHTLGGTTMEHYIHPEKKKSFSSNTRKKWKKKTNGKMEVKMWIRIQAADPEIKGGVYVILLGRERGIDIHPPREEEPHHCLDCGYIESRQVIFPFFFSPSLTAIGEVEKNFKFKFEKKKKKYKNIFMFQKSWPFFFSFFFLPFPHLKKIFSSCVSYSKKRSPRVFERDARWKKKQVFFFFVFNIFSVCVCVCILRVVRL